MRFPKPADADDPIMREFELPEGSIEKFGPVQKSTPIWPLMLVGVLGIVPLVWYWFG